MMSKSFEKFERVSAGQLRLECFNLNIRIQIGKPRTCCLRFRFANIGSSKGNLPLQVGEIHDIKIHQAQPTYARGSKVQAQRRAQSAGADSARPWRFLASADLPCRLPA